ncbi:Hypothetical protein D9617_30g011480 [Elsinoe fawcettii]|nr:Hypothetical protein D9617_30g011480 [Elsinoe fawcettii]
MEASSHGDELEAAKWILTDYMLDFEETRRSVLLVPVTRSGESGAKPIEEISKAIHDLLVQHCRGEQRYAIRTADATTGEGLGQSPEWFSNQLNERSRTGLEKAVVLDLRTVNLGGHDPSIPP